MTPDPFLFLVGGARSGKSDFAIDAARRRGLSTTFVATAQAGDADMAERIRRHREDRPTAWDLIEEPLDLVAAIETVPTDHTLVLDCLTLWAANVLLADRAEAEIIDEAARATELLGERPAMGIVVSNEVGLGVHPETDLGRHYRDLLGRVNTTVAAGADRCLFFSAGRALELFDPVALLGAAEPGSTAALRR